MEIHASLASLSILLQYTALVGPRTAGLETDRFLADGTIDSAYEYVDRGFQPKLTAHYRLAADGTLLATDIAGVNGSRTPLDEHFAVTDGRGRWRSPFESGEGAAGSF